MLNFGINEKFTGIECGIYSGFDTVCDVSSNTVEKLHKDCMTISPIEISPDWIPLENSFVVLKNGSSSALAIIQNKKLVHVRPSIAFGIEARNVEQVFALDALLNPHIPLVTVTGVAGTGKTLLALAASMENRKFYRQILMARPVMPMGKDIGYLPGSIEDKMGPYMSALMDNISIIKEQCLTNCKASRIVCEMLENDKLIVEPLTYIRGRSLSRSFLIVDEAQNLTPAEVKTIVTRAAEGTKIVLTGDVEQIDNPKLNSRTNGLADLIEKFKGQSLYAHVNLIRSERSPLAKLAGELL